MAELVATMPVKYSPNLYLSFGSLTKSVKRRIEIVASSTSTSLKIYMTLSSLSIIGFTVM